MAARRALDVLEKGLKPHPESEPLHRLAGIAAFRLADHRRAAIAFERAIQLEPGFAFNYLKLASLHVCATKELDSGMEVLDRLWRQLPDEIPAREEAARMLAECGQAEKAVDLYLTLAKIEPERNWLHRFQAGRLYHQAGLYQDALKLLTLALADGPKDSPELPAQLGATFKRLGDSKRAIELYRQALDRAPGPDLRKRLEQQLAELE